MTRVDGCIDYYNTNLKVEPLANKVTRTKRVEVWYQQYNRLVSTGYDELTGGNICAHMNNRQFEETLAIGRPGGHYQIRVYSAKLLEQQTNSSNPIPAGVKSWNLRSSYCASRFARSFVRSVQQVEDDDAFCRVLSCRFTVNK